MKQRLLLVLLALFTSIGWMTAQNNTVTITVPQNSGDVSISVSGMNSTGTFTVKGGDTDPTDLSSGWTSKSFKLKNNASSETEWTLKGNFTGLTVSNASVKSITVNHSTLKTLTASSINLTAITFTSASVLETVNVSTNQLKEITEVPASVKTLNISGNQINDITKLAKDGRTVTYGTQTANKQSIEGIVANKWSNIKTILEIENLFPTAANEGTYSYSFKKLTGSSTWGTANVRKNPSNADMYRFQSSTAYEDGTYKVSVTNTKVSGLTYDITFKVQPAEFTVKTSSSNESWGQVSAPEDDKTVTNGSSVTLTATAESNYKFSKFETTGFKTPLASGSSITATVVGPTPSDNDDDQIVTVKAIFVPKTYKLTMQSVAEGGSFYVINAKGEKLANNANVDYDSELTIVATANEKYKLDQISINGTKISEGIETTNTSGISKYKFNMPAEAQNIVVTFVAISEKRTLTADFPKDLVTIQINDQTDATISVGENAEVAINVTLIKVGVQAKKPNTKDDVYVKDILLNGKSAENIRRKDDGYTIAEFTVTADTKNMDVTVVATKRVTVTIEPKGDSNAKQQTYTYDGTEKAFQYSTTPQGLTANVQYTESSSPVTVPINAGTYNVKYWRAQDAQYKAVAANNEWKIVINKAPLTLTTPTVTVKTTNGVRTYEISGGKAEANGKTIAGKFVVNYTQSDKDGDLNVPAEETASHLVNLTFVPTAELDQKNYDYESAKVKAECKIDGKEVAKYTIKGDLKDGISVTIKNGQAVLATWTSSNSTGIKVPTEADITLEFTVPDGIKLKQVLDRAKGNDIIADIDAKDTDKELINNSIKLSKKAKDAIVDFILSTETIADPQSYTIEAISVENPFVYDGSVKLINEDNANQYYTVKIGNTVATDYTATYVYKQNGKVVVSPINAGTYDVDVTITPKNSNSGYKATTKTIQMVIKKQTVYISAEPTASKIGKGQTLASSILTGGNATVPGKFEWADKTIVPVADKAYQVVFKPTDATNYDDGYAFKSAQGVEEKEAVEIKVEISDQPVLSILTENGEITVKDANGKIYYTGDEIVKGTKLTFSATPAEGYELLSGIQVNGSTVSGTYTVGDVSMTVTANFTIKPDTYIVTLGSAPKGSKIKSKPNSNVVTSGGSYTFSLSHLAGDKPTASVGAATYQGTTSGNTTTFTIPNIKSNISITISMKATPIKITTKPTLSKAGKPMGAIRVTGVNSSNECYYGDKITVTATANPGVEFAGWEGLTSTENPYEFEATNATYTFQAKYHGVLTGIESVDELNYYGGDGYIFVNCPAQGTLTIISMNGRAQKMSVSGQTRVTVPAGVYGIVLTSGSEVVRDKVVVR